MSDWIATDKAAHAGIGAIAGLVAHEAVAYVWPESDPLERALVALIPVVLLAVAKEVADAQDPEDHCSDWKDAAATVAGGALSISLTVRF